MQVTKLNGELEDIDLSKMRASLKWASEGLDVDIMEIESNSHIQFYHGIKTSLIHDIMIKTTYDMSSTQYPDYDSVSARLDVQRIYKKVFHSINPCSLSDYVIAYSSKYNNRIHSYTDEQLTLLNSEIRHDRDLEFTAIGLSTLISKYSVHNHETPQFIFMLVAMDGMHNRPLDKVIELYHNLSTFEISLPSPEMKSLRGFTDDYASCCTIRYGDSIDGWTEADKAIVKHTVAGQGIGLDISPIASIGDLVKQGKIRHGGKLPVCHSFEKLINKSMQDGRQGSGTANVNFYDPEIIEILSLKSFRTAAERRTTNLSYTIKMNQLLFDRARANQEITLFSSRDSKELYELFHGKNVDDFIKLYSELELKFPDNERISAQKLFEQIMVDSQETSSYYATNIDFVNKYSTYDKPIYQGNICNEFAVPTIPLSEDNPDSPAIGICNLGGINQANVSLDKLEKTVFMLVDLQNKLMDIQVQPTPQARSFVKHYRDMGLGLTNHAYWVAKNHCKYGDEEILREFDIYMEHFSFYAIKASMLIAKANGAPAGFRDTYFSRGILPIDINGGSKTDLPWEELRSDIAKYGMANCGLLMQFPAETSSIIGGGTSGMEPIRDGLTMKDSKGSFTKQFAPDIKTLGHHYTYAYEEPDINRKVLSHYSIAQRWMDKMISCNLYYNPELNDGKILMSDLIDDMYLTRELEIKSIYYRNTKVKDVAVQQADTCGSGGCNL